MILISVDTLRADHLGVYGYRKVRTPHIDALAHHGTFFGQVQTPVPMTLPAHTSLLSSLWPFAHGVQENGQTVPRAVVTLPELLKARGYRTGAFIGGYVLDARFGLNRGFDVYDSPFHLPAGSARDAAEDPPEVKRPAEAVFADAAQWIRSDAEQPFFAFIHLYDVHQPYAHGSYDAEIASVDEALGRFWKSLADRRIVTDALVVLTSDHGESLGEHGEDTHGYFIYQSTLRVPLLIHWPAGSSGQSVRTDEPCSLLDIAPAVLEFLSLPVPPQFQGHSLLRPLRPGPSTPEAVYAESLYARDHLGCSALRALRLGRYKYIDAPKPELYDLEIDPGETRNRYAEDRAHATALQARLAAFSHSAGSGPATGGAATEQDPGVAARLRTLGYLGGGARHAVSGADPKDRLPQYLAYGRGIREANSGHLTEAIREFQRVIDVDPANASARFYQAVCYFRLRRLDDAVEALDATLAASPSDTRALELLGTIWLTKEDYRRAREQYARLAALAPNDFAAHFNLGLLARRDGRTEEALRELTAAVRVNPGSAPAHAALGGLYRARGEIQKAKEELTRALALDPNDRDSRKMLESLSPQSSEK